MTRVICLCIAALYFVCLCANLPAQTLFFDDFENGVSRDTSGGSWTRYPGAVEWLQGNLSHNHTPGGNQSGLAVEHDPAAFNSYADFGATDGGLRATVFLFEDMNYVPPYTEHPPWKQPHIEVRSMFSLFSQPPAGLGDPIGDYLQLRLIPDVDRPPNPPPDHFSYGIRTKYNDDHGLGIIDTGILRKESEWMKLVVEVDSAADGGEVRFFIDDALVGTSQRTGTDLRYVMLGATKLTYENYWYDDVSVVDLYGDYGDYWHGDFNGDGVTDAADFVMSRKIVPNSTSASTAWRKHYAYSSGGGGANLVPEPTSMVVVTILFGCVMITTRTRAMRNSIAR